MIPVITVDGPSGAGKGTICRKLAEATGFELLDSGALYRLTGVACKRNCVDMHDHEAVAGVAAQLDIRFVADGSKTIVLLQGEDVSLAIRTEEAGMLASSVGANPLARSALLERQRQFKQAPGLVADGRDMGTVVFKDAPYKFFLTASAEERARRRVLQIAQSGGSADFEKVLADIEKRDYQDRNRATAPLLPAEDAIEIDSTSMSIEDVFICIMEHVNSSTTHRDLSND